MEPPCSCAKRCAKLAGSALMMKLISPCRWSVTLRERWRATAGNPIWLNNDRSSVGSGAVYSTNSNPSVPIGLPEIVIYLLLRPVSGGHSERYYSKVLAKLGKWLAKWLTQSSLLAIGVRTHEE